MDELIEKINKALVEKNNYLHELDGIGIFGSIARGNYDEYSDIDVFVVVKPEYDDKDGCALHDKWHHRIRDILSEFRRDITVLVYSIPSLKKIPTWSTLRLPSEGILAYDPEGKVKKVFEAMIRAAKKAGLEERQGTKHKYWAPKRPLKRGEIIEVEVKDEEL